MDGDRAPPIVSTLRCIAAKAAGRGTAAGASTWPSLSLVGSPFNRVVLVVDRAGECVFV